MRSRKQHEARHPLTDLVDVADDALTGVGTTMTVPSGTRLCRKGEYGRQVFFVLDGEVAVSESGRLIAVLGAGDILGEGAMRDFFRNADAVCITDATVHVLTPPEFRSLCEADPKLSERVDELARERAA